MAKYANGIYGWGDFIAADMTCRSHPLRELDKHSSKSSTSECLSYAIAADLTKYANPVDTIISHSVSVTPVRPGRMSLSTGDIGSLLIKEFEHRTSAKPESSEAESIIPSENNSCPENNNKKQTPAVYLDPARSIDSPIQAVLRRCSTPRCLVPSTVFKKSDPRAACNPCWDHTWDDCQLLGCSCVLTEDHRFTMSSTAEAFFSS